MMPKSLIDKCIKDRATCNTKRELSTAKKITIHTRFGLRRTWGAMVEILKISNRYSLDVVWTGNKGVRAFIWLVADS